jgi:hypothetical protein
MVGPVNLSQTNSTKAGWRIPEWCRDTGTGRSMALQLIKDGKIKSVKIGKSRVITTTPGEFLNGLAERQAA